ncbi:NB-ARC domain-containing protein [Streptomyces sp. NPDC047829]|uniref:NB-ARC domain-containing protein n=1 Tax=Streptomyces sp. NPDC047829 TaxID=3154609 RepID=UPI0034039970
MGGVGKTQLAADYARAAWNEGSLDVLVWASASAQSPVVSAYAQAGVELCRADPEDPEQAAKQFLAWLAPKPGHRPCRWLIVLDDVSDPNDLIVHPDEPGNRYSLWPPANPHGRTLLTTRRRDAALFGARRRRGLRAVRPHLGGNADVAVIITNGRVTGPAVTFAQQQRLHVVDRQTLAVWASGSRPLWELLRAVPPPRRPTSLS